jgi:hypothetical protein
MQKPTKVQGTIAPPSTPQPTMEPKQLVHEKGLIIVSNRLPISVKRDARGRYWHKKSSGGLVTGLSGIVQDASFKWYGWPGLSVPEEELEELESSLKEQHNAVAVPLDNDLADMHYNGFSSMCIKPMFQLLANASLSRLNALATISLPGLLQLQSTRMGCLPKSQRNLCSSARGRLR